MLNALVLIRRLFHQIFKIKHMPNAFDTLEKMEKVCVYEFEECFRQDLPEFNVNNGNRP